VRGVPDVAGEAMVWRGSTTNKEKFSADNEASRPHEVSGKRGREKSKRDCAHE